MIVVRVELHSAITGKITEIGRMDIYNDGTSHSAAQGNYVSRLYRRTKTFSKVLRTGKILNHPRLSQSVWKLVAKALTSVKI